MNLYGRFGKKINKRKYRRNLMKEFTVEEVIRFSQTIEEESYKFYTEAEKKFPDEELKKLLKELAEAEVDHLNRLRALLKETKLSEGDLKEKVQLEDTGYDSIVKTQSIPDDADARSVLNIALEREEKTAGTYKMLLNFSNLSDEILDVFEYLAAQEEGHVKIIENKLSRL